MTFSVLPHDFSYCVHQLCESPCHALSRTCLVFYGSYNQKNLFIEKKYLYIFLLNWYDFIPMVGFLLGLQHACSVDIVMKVHL